MKKVWIMMGLVTTITTLRAQEKLEFSGLDFKYTPFVTPQFEDDNRLENIKYSVLETSFFINYAEKIKGNIDFYTGLNTNLIKFNTEIPGGIQRSILNDTFPKYLTNPKNLYRINLSFGPRIKLTKDWTLNTFLGITAASDFNSYFGFKDLVFDTTILAVKEVSKNKRFGFGTYLFKGQDRFIPFPIASGYLKTGKWEMAAILPLNLTVSYNLSGNHSLNFEGELDFSDFNLQSGRGNELYGKAETLQYQGVFAGFSYSYLFDQHWNFYAGLSAAYRSFTFDTAIKDHELIFNNTYSINWGLVYIVL